MTMHLQILATGFYGMSQAEGLSPAHRWIYEHVARGLELSKWLAMGSLRRNLAREQARDVADLVMELRRRGFETRYARRLAKVIVADRRLHTAMWNALLARAT